MTKTVLKEYYKNLMLASLELEPQSKDTVTQARIKEVVDALALGCVLSKPRRFANRVMGAENFRQIAENITMNQVAACYNRVLANANVIQNRVWYILGVFARSGPSR